MKFLTQTKNNHFYLGDGHLFHTDHDKCIMQVKKDNGANVDVELYTSGALLKFKDAEKIELLFVDNSGHDLVYIFEDELNEMGSRIYDINLYPCETGVLAAYKFRSGGERYDYHTYLGGVFTSTNKEDIKQMVKKYENALGVFYNDEKSM